VPEPKHAAPRPTTFGEVLQDPEYRAVYVASALSWLGDYLARAAVTALVLHTTHSVALSAASFAVGYLPGLTAGPLLAALAERYPRRTVMVTCDVARAGLIAVVAVPGLPVQMIFLFLFATALLGPPFDASRSALLPQLLDGERYVVALSMQNTTDGAATVVGYLVGGALAPILPHGILLIDSLTFLGSAALIAFRTRTRPSALSPSHRSGLVRETAAGFQLVFRSQLLRSIAVIVLGSWLFQIVPEGLAAAWASKLARMPSDQGLDQALIMMAVPFGNVVGAIVVGRMLSPARRRRLIRPLAVVTPLALVPALLHPSAGGAALMAAVAGFAVSGIAIPANAIFVQAVPIAFRARAFGVMQFGAQLVQATGLIVTGLLADQFDLPTIIGIWGIAGVGVMVVVGLSWPSSQTIDATIHDVKTANAAALAPPAAQIEAGTAPPAPDPSPRPSPRPRPGLRSAHRTEQPACLTDPQT
jgi:MFS family permease